ncbi:catalytic protein [Daldinia decipiens]|uniref:catalytic protein n=1 Tax=Daldinia decipiens TaxID=326647 RepID=UPI0020C4C4FF|nr:catalytic protein [Daldinia decipiens]KAI1654338.1 catalytic protein [Daldinia decipiens]
MASTAPSQLTILLIQGSFQLPEVYRKLTKALEARGYPVIHPLLPSLAVLRRLVEEKSRTVLVLMHSYGGLVGSEAVLDEFGWNKRKDRGLTGGVIYLFFFAAFVLAEEAEYWTSKIIDQSYAVQTTKLTRAAYRYIPSTYVVCGNDQGPPPQYQEMWGKNAGSIMLRINSGHSPMLNKTDELVNMIVEAAHGAIKNAY